MGAHLQAGHDLAAHALDVLLREGWLAQDFGQQPQAAKGAVDDYPFGFDDDDLSDADSKMLIEVGCKVYEVNRVLYRNQPNKNLLAQL